MHIAPSKPLIRARSVVRVHPGPPSKSVITRLSSLSPSRGLVIEKPFCQKFAKSSGRPGPPSSRAYSSGATVVMMLRDLGAPKYLVQERKKPMEILGADDGEELLWADLMWQEQAAETTVSREIPD